MTSRDVMNETELVIGRGRLLQNILEEERVVNNIIGEAKLDARIDILKELLKEFLEEAGYTNMHHAILVVKKNLDILNRTKKGLCDE